MGIKDAIFFFFFSYTTYDQFSIILFLFGREKVIWPLWFEAKWVLYKVQEWGSNQIWGQIWFSRKCNVIFPISQEIVSFILCWIIFFFLYIWNCILFLLIRSKWIIIWLIFLSYLWSKFFYFGPKSGFQCKIICWHIEQLNSNFLKRKNLCLVKFKDYEYFNRQNCLKYTH